MADPKPCPFDHAELLRLYDQGRSTAVIAAYCDLTGDTIHKSTVCRWMRAEGVANERYSPYTAKKLDSPFSAARLRELYWHEGQSVSEIGALAAPLLGRKRPVFNRTVTAWLHAAGITLRTVEEAQRVRAVLHPEQFVEPIKAAQAALAAAPEKRITRPHGLAPRDRRRGIKAAAKKRAIRETRMCARCGKPVTRRPCHFRHPPERTFCGKPCAALNTADEKLRAKENQ